jgi:hypothetical protein
MAATFSNCAGKFRPRQVRLQQRSIRRVLGTGDVRRPWFVVRGSCLVAQPSTRSDLAREAEPASKRPWIIERERRHPTFCYS